MKKPTAAELAAFRKLDAVAQREQLRGTRIERVFQVERDTIDKEARTVWLSIASDQPYERWWGVEILDMERKSIRTERLASGFAILVGHDTSDQVGVAVKFEISPDKKLRVQARFSKSARGEEIFQDVLDGIRVNASVGYIIHDLILEKQVEEVATYRVTDWEPYEGSLVAVPADITVGVGRELEQTAPPTRTSGETMTPQEEQALREKIAKEERAKLEQEARDKAAAAANTPEAVLTRERQRIADITAAGAEYKDFDGVKIAAEEAAKPNGTVESFKLRMLDAMRNKQKPSQTAEAGRTSFGDGARHIIGNGVELRSFTKPVHYSDGSKMEPIEAAYRSGQWLLATVGQNAKAARWCREHGLGHHIELRVGTVDVDSAGGYTVPDEMEQSIIDLRAQYGLARRLTRRRPMARDTLSVPKRVTGVTPYFVQEDNTGVTTADKGWGQVNFVAKTLAALSLVSQNIEEDSVIGIVDDLVGEQAYAFALKEDQCWLIGDGTSTYGGMTGLIPLFEASALASRPDAASGHDTFAEYDNADITAVMGAVADFAGLNPVWLGSKLFANVVLNRLKATAGGNNVQTLEGRPKDQYLGYDVYTSEVMPKVLTDLSDKVNAFYGDFSKSSSFGDRRGIMVQVLRERYAEKLQVGILSSERFHVVNHDVGDTSTKGPVAALYGE